MRTINLIAAVDEEFGFGKDGKIPWHYPEDLKFFKEKTKGHVCIMGRKTFDDLLTYAKGKHVLPGRQCIVVTSTHLELGERPNAMSIREMEEWKYNNVHEVKTVSDALNISRNMPGDVFFIGGERIFASGLNMADCVYLTMIPGKHGCDRFFPHEKLRNSYQIYNKREGGDGLVFHTYVHNIFGSKNPHN